MIIVIRTQKRIAPFDEEAQRYCNCEDDYSTTRDEQFISYQDRISSSNNTNHCLLRLLAFVVMIITAMGPSIKFLIHSLHENKEPVHVMREDNGSYALEHRYYQGHPIIPTTPRTFSVILNYRVEARIVGINDYGDMERIFGYSERFDDVITGQEARGDGDVIELHDVDPKFAHLTIRTLSPSELCDFQYSLRIMMNSGFGTTNEFQTVTTCGNDGLTYSIMVQVSIIENHASRRTTGRLYDIHFMNQIFEDQYSEEEGWERVETSNRYRIRKLSAGDTVLDPDHKTISLVEDGPNFVVICISYDNDDEIRHSFRYHMAIPMEPNGTGFSSGKEALRSSSSNDRTFATLLHAFVIEV